MTKLTASLCQTLLRTASLPVRAVKIPYVLQEAIVSGHHACVKTVHVSGRAQGFALVPFSVTGRQDAREGLVAAVVAVDQIGAAVYTIDVGACDGVKVGRCHEHQSQGQEGGQE